MDNFEYLREAVGESDLMIFCDPPYIAEEKLTLTNYYGVTRWTRQSHIDFLEIIKNASCSVMVCNYIDSDFLYDNYLTAERGWTRRIFPNVTKIGGYSGNPRNEAVWVNY
jgi:site-specific DNA-adenine methylase